MQQNFISISENKNTVFSAPGFSAALSLDCGQAFRWKADENGVWHGVAYGRALTLCEKDGRVTLFDVDENEFNSIWRNYFDLDRDYESLKKSYAKDKSLKKAVGFCGGIHILNQEPWEALCSFIISQNNNIPRIKGIVERLCALLGDRLENGDYSFPTPAKIVEAGVDGLAPIRSGFRAKYIYDAAVKVQSGEIDFEKIKALPLTEAAEELKKIKGVGDKVAACALLYGLGRADAFPVDVWVKRILEELYPCGLPACTNGTAGIAQQYLFHWRRNNGGQ
ncbi:MAG: DNA-3-methyladenine glycosylase 2 family protein [Clostridia bacterium]|nr:DNA-3-methyladenine glycosylase 2 family protein [Clostridia bacterium]